VKVVDGMVESFSWTRSNDIRGSNLAVTVPCTLEEFEHVSLNVRSRMQHENKGRSHFMPDFSHTQCPSLNSKAFTIAFPSFKDVCSVIGIESMEDRIRMVQKTKTKYTEDLSALMSSSDARIADETVKLGEGRIASVTMRRVMGSVLKGSGAQCRSCIIYVGCTAGFRGIGDASFNEGDGEIREMVIYRERDDYHVVDRRFEFPLKCGDGDSIPIQRKLKEMKVWTDYLGRDTTLSDAEVLSMMRRQVFFLKWNASRPPSFRVWSHNISKPEHVLGTLELNIPVALVGGVGLCSEFGELLHYNTIKSIVE